MAEQWGLNDKVVDTASDFGSGDEVDQHNPLRRGWNKMTQSVGITGALARGDYKGGAQKIAEADTYQKQNPGTPEGKALMQAWDRGQGITGGLQEVGGQFSKDWNAAPTKLGAIRSLAKNVQAMGSGVLEQTPNMVAPMGLQLAGGVAGAAAGSAVPVVGTVAGGIAGALAGASLGNTAVEGGGMAQEALHAAGVDPQDKTATEAYLNANGDKLLGQAGVKGGIIGAVDTATLRFGHGILKSPAEQAAKRAITALGIDITDHAAVKAASGAIAAKMATDPIYKAASTGAGNLARNVGVAALEPGGEFAGEYVGQGVATGDWNEKNAFLEAASSVGQGAITFAGQKAYAGAKQPFGANDVVAEAPPATTPPVAPALQIGNTPDPYLSFPDGTVARRSEIDAYINGLPADQQPAARAKMMGLAPQPAAPEPAPIKPSEAMGLDPAAGPMSAAAVTAVDTGAHQEIQLQQASEADQAAYEQATAEQDRQAEELDTATRPITSGPIAEAAMSPEDKRAVLFSNQAVADGGIQYKGTLDGDILNGLGKPYPNRLAAARRANMEGKDWTIAQVKDGFVARRKDANGPSTEVQPGDTGSTGGRSTDSPASVGVGATDGNGVGAQSGRSPDAVLDQADQLPKRVDAKPLTATTRAQPTTLGKQTTATAGPGFTAKDVTRVQNAAPRANTTPAAPAVETSAVVAGDAAASEGVPGAGPASVEGDGIDADQADAPSIEDINSGKAFVDNTKSKIAEWVSKATNNGTREIDRNWERAAVKRFVEANIKPMLDGKQTGNRASAKVAVGKAQTFPELSAAIEKFAQPKPVDPRLTQVPQPQEQPNGTTPAQAITPTPQREAQAPDASQRLTPAQAGKLQEAHKAHGLDVTLQAVQRMHDRVMKSLITGKGSNGGVEYNIKPKERKELQAQADRLANDLSLFGVQQEAASPAPAPVAPNSIRDAFERKRAEKAKPAEQPAAAPEEASSSRPDEPSAEQIKSVKDITLTTKVGDSVVKKTSNASKAMKALNERADALEMVRKCLA